MECPNCGQSIKRPPLPPGASCLCPKCNQPFTLAVAEPAVQPPAEAIAPRRSTAPAPEARATPERPPRPKAAAPKAAAPQPAEFPLHCYLCGSLLYARLDQVGSTVKCHDCHSANEVRAPRPQDLRPPSQGPSLDDAEEFALSETFERPKFSPIEKSPTDKQDGADDHYRPIIVTPTQSVSPSDSAAAPADPAGTGMVDLFYSAGPVPPDRSAPSSPAQQSPAKPPPTSNAVPAATRPPTTTPKPRIRQHADSYGDELWSSSSDPSRPAFERSPFLVGIVEFLLYPGTMPRWLTLVALATIPIAFFEMTAAAAGPFGSLFSGAALGLLFFAACSGVPWLGILGAHAISIVQDTGQGRDVIEEWPLGGFVPRGNPFFLAISAAVGSLPGLLVFALYYLSQEAVSLRGVLMMLVSAMLLAPLLWLPMLLEKSIQAPFHSQTFWHSFKFSGDGWIVFYCETLFLALIAASGVAMWNLGSVVLAPLSAVLLVTPLLVYFRILGRLLWYIDPAMTPPPPAAKPPPAPLPETVDPLMMKK